MANQKIEGRTQYLPSGKIRWATFFPLALASIITAVVLAGVMALLFRVGWYLVVIVPLFAALGLGWVVRLAAKRGHCRRPFVAGALGIVSGIILYLGYYHIGMVQALGPEYAGNVSLLPKYIRFRMASTVLKDVHHSDYDNHPKAPGGFGVGMNWAIFVFEFAFVMAISAGMALRSSRKPYCESCNAWMNREVTTFKPEIGPGLVETLRLGSVQSLAALFTSPPKPAAPNTSVAVDHCPHAKERGDCDIYISVKQVLVAAKGAALDAFDQAKGKLIANQVLLNTAEMPALLGRFPALEAVAGTTAAQALQELQVEVPPSAPSHATAEIKPVEAPYAGKVLTTKMGLLLAAFSLLGLVGVFGPIGLAALGSHFGFPHPPPPDGVSLAMKSLGVALLVLAAVIFVANMVIIFTVPDYFGTKYLRRFTQRELGRRPNFLVNPTDPSARFVQVIPRANWSRLKLIDATDIGFLRVDKEYGGLLFEGDKEQYRIPAAAITSCDIEAFVVGQGSEGATTVFRVVVQANGPKGFWEVPFAERGNSGKFRKKSRQKWATELHGEICGLMAAGNAQSTPA